MPSPPSADGTSARISPIAPSAGILIPKGSCVAAPPARGEPFDSPLMVSLSNHERLAQDVLVEPRAVGRPSAFAEATADRRSAKREGWSTSSGRRYANSTARQD